METYKAFEDALACGRAAGLNLPDVILRNALELELVRNFLRSHGCVFGQLSTLHPSSKDWDSAERELKRGKTNLRGCPACSQTRGEGRPSSHGLG